MLTSLLLTGCHNKGSQTDDPYESINRKTHAFNMVVDKVVLKPTATLYKAILPAPVRSGINNVYNNVNMLPTIANDLLQAKGTQAIKDTWRLIANTTIGVGGIFDVASTFNLPPHSNDLGLTFAQWGDRNSPYIVIPLLGPSTFRDGMGMLFDYTFFTPYPYLNSSIAIYSLLAVRYVDLRSQMLETDHLIAESLDQYAFIRDAYLQHRHYLITGEQEEQGDLYVGEDGTKEVPKLLPTDPQAPSRFPLAK